MKTAHFKFWTPIAWPAPGSDFKVGLTELSIAGVVSFEGEEPVNTPPVDEAGRAASPKPLKLATRPATVVDEDGHSWTIPAGYYEVTITPR